ncbi:MAG: hypothetical protein IIW72_07955 [Clostridia bacterium]|nr:hypothetical protein [Clostridia bacterium]
MASISNRKDLRTELRTMKFEFDLLQRIPCSEEENRAFKRYLEDGQDLPQGVYRYRNSDGKNSETEFYTVYDPDLTEREMNEFLKMRQMQILKSIKGAIMLFGTAISVLLLVIVIFMLAK